MGVLVKIAECFFSHPLFFLPILLGLSLLLPAGVSSIKELDVEGITFEVEGCGTVVSFNVDVSPTVEGLGCSADSWLFSVTHPSSTRSSLWKFAGAKSSSTNFSRLNGKMPAARKPQAIFSIVAVFKYDF